MSEDRVFCTDLTRGHFPADPPIERKILEHFLALAGQGEAEDVVDFVETHGILEIDTDGSLSGPRAGAGDPLDINLSGHTLSPAAVRQWSRWFGAVLRIGQRLAEGKRGNSADWELLAASDFPPARNGRPDTKTDQREVLASLMTVFLATLDVTLSVVWVPRDNGGRPRIEPVAHSLMGLLAIHLTRTMAGVETTTVECTSCGTRYVPKRPPRDGEATYCSLLQCKKAQNRFNVQASRDRRKAEQK